MKSAFRLTALGTLASMAVTSFANESTVIDALVRKGVLNKAEAEQIRAQAHNDSKSDKLRGKAAVGETGSSLKFTGEVRLRYQYGNQAK